MDLKGLSGGLYQPLTPQNIETIHHTALTILEKTGFTKEGVMRDMIYNQGNWRDFALYSILRKEWKEPVLLKI